MDLAPRAVRLSGFRTKIQGMEGVLLVIKAWGLAALMIWVHRRFFERIAPADREFEARCERGPLIAALRAAPGQLESIEAALRASLGKRRLLVATLGGWPWPNYELHILVSRAADVLRLSVTRAELRKTHGVLAPSLTATLRDFLNAHPNAIEDMWLLPDVVYGLGGPGEAPAGWLVLAGDEPRAQVRAREDHPTWLGEPRSIGVREPAAADQEADARVLRDRAARPKLLSFRSEC